MFMKRGYRSEVVQYIKLISGLLGYRTGLIGKKNVAPDDVYPFDFEFYDQLNCIFSSLMH